MLSKIKGTGTGSAPIVNLTFPFIAKDHVKAAVGGLGATITWTGAAQVAFAEPVPSGTQWVVYRETPMDPALVDFTNGAVLTEADLDLSHTQHRYVEQELADKATDAINNLNLFEDEEKAAVLAAETRLADRMADLEGIFTMNLDAFVGVPADGLGAVFPEMFGAVGDGVTNDTAAFQQLAAYINAGSGGVIAFRPGATYIVGLQTLVNDGTDMFKGQPILTLEGGVRELVILGNGAKMRLAPGLKFGTFDAAGSPTDNGSPYTGGERSSPVEEGLLAVKNWTGRVTIHNLELDGNDAAQAIGGPYGDTGRQIPATGLFLSSNTGGEDIRGVYTHHHLLDGIQISGASTVEDTPQNGSTISVRAEYNARQGMSLVGGRGYTIIDSKFNHTGRGVISSPPSAGVDLEAEIGIIRDVRFITSEFNNNTGPGVQHVGDVANIDYDTCSFMGTTSWSIWLDSPYTTVRNCTVMGAGTHQYGSADPKKATQFIGTKFLAGLARSPSGVLYLPGGLMFDGGAGSDENVLFENCVADSEGNTSAILPFFANGGAIWRDSTFKQDGTTTSYVRGNFHGQNTFTIGGANDFYTSTNYGRLVVNGVEQQRVISSDLKVSDGSVYVFGTTTARVQFGYVGPHYLLEALDPFVAYEPFKINGSPLTFQHSGVDWLETTAGGVNLKGAGLGYYVDGNKMIGPPAPAIANPSYAAGSAPTAAEYNSLIDKFITLLNILRPSVGPHGLISG